MKVTPIPSYVGTEDTPVWMIHKNSDGKYVPALVAWHNFDQFNEKGFLTLRTFGTREEAEAYLKDFWESYWRLAL